MAELIGDLRSPGPALRDDATDASKVFEEPIDALALDHEPGAAVDPRTPLAEGGDRVGRVTVVELPRQRVQSLARRRARRVVVQAQIDVRARCGGAACLRAAEHDRGDA